MMPGTDKEAYLVQRIDEVLAELAAVPEGSERILAHYHVYHVRGIADGLVTAGALSQAAAQRLLAELGATLVERGLVEEIHVHLESSGRTTTLQAAGAAAPSADRQTGVLRAPPPHEFVRVVPLSGSLANRPDIVLMSLDIWSDGFELRCALMSPSLPQDARRRRRDSPHWEARDDLGRHYTTNSDSWSPHVQLFRFQPQLPDVAKELILLARDGDGFDVGEVVVELMAS